VGCDPVVLTLVYASLYASGISSFSLAMALATIYLDKETTYRPFQTNWITTKKELVIRLLLLNEKS